MVVVAVVVAVVVGVGVAVGVGVGVVVGVGVAVGVVVVVGVAVAVAVGVVVVVGVAVAVAVAVVVAVGVAVGVGAYMTDPQAIAIKILGIVRNPDTITLDQVEIAVERLRDYGEECVSEVLDNVDAERKYIENERRKAHAQGFAEGIEKAAKEVWQKWATHLSCDVNDICRTIRTLHAEEKGESKNE